MGTLRILAIAAALAVAPLARAQAPATQPSTAASRAADEAALLQAATDGKLQAVRQLLARGVGRAEIPPVWLALTAQTDNRAPITVATGAAPPDCPVLFEAARRAAGAAHDDVLQVLLLAIWERRALPLQSPAVRSRPLLVAVADGDSARVAAYLHEHDRPDWAVVGPAYQLAAQEGRIELCRLLRPAATASLAAAMKASNDGNPFSAAIQGAKADEVRALLGGGADANGPDYLTGLTPLEQAIDRGEETIIKVLLDAGADPKLRDSQGRTAIDYARAAGHAQLVHVLEPPQTPPPNHAP